ncbi:MAG TPA: CocE/NonD family hydrolase, partial [Pyrinomonadaceae bacterium]|nr:CocE/NonD family hydrolase [Pyrinomonadaceae bacterium]
MHRNLLIFAFIVILAALPSAAFSQQPAQQPTPVEVKIAPQIFDAYTGQYEDKTNLSGIVFSFFREGEHFYGRVTGQDRFEMFASSETKFFLKTLQADAEFLRDAGGTITGMIWRQGSQKFITKKTANVPQADARVPYKRSEVMIPMRDGVKLYTVIVTPEKQTEAAAILMVRTPYGVKANGPGSANRNPELAKEGYVFVYQDIRGRYGSEGKFMMNRPMRDKRDPKSV